MTSACASPDRHLESLQREQPSVRHRPPQWEQPAEAQQHKARKFSCASLASSISLNTLPIHNALTFSNSVFCNAIQFRLELSPYHMHAPRVRSGCGALVDPFQAHLSRTSFITLKRAPSSPLQELGANTFSVELGARSCNQPGCLPPLSPTARELRDQTRSPQLVTGRTSSVSSRTASFSPMSQ